MMFAAWKDRVNDIRDYHHGTLSLLNRERRVMKDRMSVGLYANLHRLRFIVVNIHWIPRVQWCYIFSVWESVT